MESIKQYQPADQINRDDLENRTNSTIPARSPPNCKPLVRDMLVLLAKVGAIILSFVLLFTLIFGLTRMPDTSMDPAMKEGDLIVYYRLLDNGYEPGDVIVLRWEGETQIRRVIATEGDEVDIGESGLVVNGAVQQELGIYQPTERFVEGVHFPLVVPEGHVFVLGDGRETATDSRIYGTVGIRDTLGKVMTVIRRRSI